jgi:hypothetical protein
VGKETQVSKCLVVYATGDPQQPARRCSKRAAKGKGSPCKEHGRQLLLMDEPEQNGPKLRYLTLVEAFEEWEDVKGRAGKDPRAADLVAPAFRKLVQAARGRPA